MALQVPTVADINETILAQLEADLNESVPLLPKAFLRVVAKVMAGVFILVYKYAGFTALQSFVRTASGKDTVINGQTVSPLALWGRLIGVGDRSPATRAILRVNVSVKRQGGTLPLGTALVNNATRVVYLTQAAVALDADDVLVDVRASGDAAETGGAGAQGNVAVGTELTFANVGSNVDSIATVTAVLAVAADRESEAHYRGRVIDRFQKRPQGGAPADYELWGEEPAGIVNVYPYRSDHPGQVDVYAEATPDSSGNADGIPTQLQLDQVEAAITLDVGGVATRLPVGPVVTVRPITRTAFDVSVTGIVGVANPVQVRADIESALADYFKSRAPYIAGLTIPPREDRISAAAVAGVVDDIVGVAGGLFSAVQVFRAGGRIDIYSLGIGEKAKLGNVTY